MDKLPTELATIIISFLDERTQIKLYEFIKFNLNIININITTPLNTAICENWE